MDLKQNERVWTGLMLLGGYADLAGCYEHSNKLLGFIKCKELFDYLRNCQLLKKHSAPYSDNVILVSPALTAGIDNKKMLTCQTACKI